MDVQKMERVKITHQDNLSLIETLPFDVLYLIFGWLSFRDLCNVNQTCKTFSSSNTNQNWKKLFLDMFPDRERNMIITNVDAMERMDIESHVLYAGVFQYRHDQQTRRRKHWIILIFTVDSTSKHMEKWKKISITITIELNATIRDLKFALNRLIHCPQTQSLPAEFINISQEGDWTDRFVFNPDKRLCDLGLRDYEQLTFY